MIPSKTSLILIYFIAFTLSSSCQSQVVQSFESEKLAYTLEPVITNMEIPWGMAFLPDGSMLVTEKKGELIHFKNGQKILVKNVPKVYTKGQGGLLDLELHPNYDKNGWIYISYASSEGQGEGGNTAIIRAKLKDDALIDIEKLYKAEPNTTKGQHFGSRIEFDNDGYLYFSIGDRGNLQQNPQDITRDGGKIYRLFDDGRIPQDNKCQNCHLFFRSSQSARHA
jgi:glucose/arabinose dehydrogenase